MNLIDLLVFAAVFIFVFGVQAVVQTINRRALINRRLNHDPDQRARRLGHQEPRGL